MIVHVVPESVPFHPVRLPSGMALYWYAAGSADGSAGSDAFASTLSALLRPASARSNAFCAAFDRFAEP